MYKKNGSVVIERLIGHAAKGGLIVLLGSITSRIIGFIFHILLARGLGTASYGLYSLGQNIFDIIVSITSLGNGTSMIRFGAIHLGKIDKSRLKGLIISNLLIAFFLSTFIAIILFIFAKEISIHIFKKEDLTNVMRLFSIGLPFYSLVIISTAITIIFHNMKYRVLLQGFIQPLANLILLIIFFTVGWRLGGAIWAFILANVVCIISSIHFIKELFPDILTTLPVYEIKKNIAYAIPITLGTLITFLLINSDSLMLGILSSVQDVAIYNVVLKSTLPIFIFSGFFIAPLYPIIADLTQENQLKPLNEVYRITAEWGAWINFIPFIIIVIFSKEIILLFGSNYSAAIDLVFILSLAFFIESCPGSLKQILQMGKAQKLEFLNSLVAILLNVGLIILLIKRSGIYGVAAAHLVTVLVMIIIRIFEVKRIFKINPFSLRYIKFLCFCLVTTCIAVILVRKLDFISKLIATAIIFSCYTLLIYFLKSRYETDIWNKIKSKLFHYRPAN